MTLALDASALIAHLDATDGHHHRATEILLAAVGGRFLAHPLTLAECLVVPVRAGRESEVTAALDDLRLETTPVDRASPLRLARLRVATGLRMPDCCALDVARQYEATLVTFDDRQRTAASTMGVPATDADPRRLSDDDRQALRHELRAERERVARQLAGLERTFDELVAAADLEPSDDEHDPDGTTAYERAQVTSLAAEARTHLAELDRALAAVRGGDEVGTCERCGRPIGIERLLALPATRRCVTCATTDRR